MGCMGAARERPQERLGPARSRALVPRLRQRFDRDDLPLLHEHSSGELRPRFVEERERATPVAAVQGLARGGEQRSFLSKRSGARDRRCRGARRRRSRPLRRERRRGGAGHGSWRQRLARSDDRRWPRRCDVRANRRGLRGAGGDRGRRRGCRWDGWSIARRCDTYASCDQGDERDRSDDLERGRSSRRTGATSARGSSSARASSDSGQTRCERGPYRRVRPRRRIRIQRASQEIAPARRRIGFVEQALGIMLRHAWPRTWNVSREVARATAR